MAEKFRTVKYFYLCSESQYESSHSGEACDLSFVIPSAVHKRESLLSERIFLEKEVL